MRAQAQGCLDGARTRSLPTPAHMLHTYAEIHAKVATLSVYTKFMPVLEKHAQAAAIVRAKKLIADGSAMVSASDVQRVLGTSYVAPAEGVTIEQLFAHFGMVPQRTRQPPFAGPAIPHRIGSPAQRRARDAQRA